MSTDLVVLVILLTVFEGMEVMRDIPHSCLSMTIKLGSDQNLMMSQLLSKPSDKKERCTGHTHIG